MEVVNGIPCFNCTDVERAKKSAYQDVTNPTDIASQSAQDVSRQFSAANSPLDLGDRGRVFNFAT
ncbi:MAG: hypothetical protein JNN22_00945 [Rhodospirillales bacterium]|nr:hypothetical protein [Rhodospirillales bacterium]